MKVNICWSVYVEGMWWDVQSEHSISDALSSSDKLAKIRSTIAWLGRGKGILPRTGTITPTDTGKNGQGGGEPETGRLGADVNWPAPDCKVHGDTMTASKTQRETGHTMFFCPQKLASGYCKHRAKVNVETGIPKFWEVK